MMNFMNLLTNVSTGVDMKYMPLVIAAVALFACVIIFFAVSVVSKKKKEQQRAARKAAKTEKGKDEDGDSENK